MAQGSIRIIRDETTGAGGPIQGASGATSKTRGITITPDNSSATSSGPSSRPTTERKPKHSETKRAALSVEDRDGVVGSEVAPKVQPNKTTPAPTSEAPKPRVYNRSPRRYMAETESEQTAKFLLSAVEMVGVTVAGPVGEMTEFERGMLTPPFKRILQRTPIGVIEKTTPLIDICFLVMGGAIYFNRISGGIKFPSRPKVSGTQEDMQSPQAAPVEKTVETLRPGDVDGIAVPVPSAITQHMNGTI